MNENMSLLFREGVRIIYPSIGLSGKKDKEFLNAPFLGFGVVEFQRGTVWVTTIGFDDEAVIDVAIYDGIPLQSELPTSTICVSGFIEVDKAGIIVAAGAAKEADLKWPEGLTAVLVVLDAVEATNKTVKSVTFYLKHFQKRKWSIFNR